MKKTLLVFIFFFFLTFQSNAQAYQWAKGIGGAGIDLAWYNVSDATGNVYSVGSFSGTVDFDPGPGVFNLIPAGGGFNAFILKLDQNGNFVWAKTFDGPIGSNAHSIALDVNGNVYTTGGFGGTVDFDPGPGTFTLQAIGGGDSFISKLDPNGNFMWAKSFGGMSGTDGGTGITIDINGDLIATGSFYSTGDFDPGSSTFTLSCTGNSDTFVLKLDANGNFIWAKSIGDLSYDDSNGIISDASANIFVTGHFGGTVDFDPGSGVSNITSNGGDDVFILKLDLNGNFVWGKNLGGPGTDESFAICLDVIGNVYTTGYFVLTADFNPNAGVFNIISSGNPDAFICKLDMNGNFIWAKGIGGAGYDYGRGIISDVSGNVFTVGDFENIGDFDPNTGTYSLTSSGCSDAFISKLDLNGNFLWAKSFGGTGCEHGKGIYQFSNSIYVCGFFGNTSDFNPPSTSTITSNGLNDIFIAKYSSNSLTIPEYNSITELIIFPQPSNDVVKLTIQNHSEEKISIEIFDTNGKIVFSKTEYLNSDCTTIPTHNLSDGIYYLKIRNSKDQFATKKLTVMH